MEMGALVGDEMFNDSRSPDPAVADISGRALLHHAVQKGEVGSCALPASMHQQPEATVT